MDFQFADSSIVGGSFIFPSNQDNFNNNVISITITPNQPSIGSKFYSQLIFKCDLNNQG